MAYRWMYLLTLPIGKFPTQLLKLVFTYDRLEKAIASTELISSWIVLPGNFPCGSVCFISVLNDIWDFPILIFICHLSKLICFTFGDSVQLWWLKFKVQWPYCRAGSSWTGSSIDPMFASFSSSKPPPPPPCWRFIVQSQTTQSPPFLPWLAGRRRVSFMSE